MALRSCLSCRTRRPRNELLRLVVGEAGRVELDWTARRPGRGAWVCPRPDCLERLEAQARLIERALRCRCKPGPLLEQARRAGGEALLARLGSAWRAGCIVAGRERLIEQLGAGALAGLLLAADASDRRLGALLTQAGDMPIARLEVGRSEMGRRLGRGPRAALGVRPGAPARPLLRELQRCASLGYPSRQHRTGARPEATRRPACTESRGQRPPGSRPSEGGAGT